MTNKPKWPSNVHGYEKKIKEIYQKCMNEDKEIYPPFNSVINEIHEYVVNCMIDQKIKTKALKAVHLLEKDHGTKRNIDDTNNINIGHLLPRVWQIVKKLEQSGKNVFIQQLADITKGSCSQGRSIRLVQFYIIYKS